MKEITRDEYLEALAIVHRYTLEEIRRDKVTVDNIVIENNRINAIHDQVRNIVVYYDLDKRSGNGKQSRRNDLVQKRQALAWWLRRNTNKSLNDIGTLIGIDNHCTVLHAIKRMENAMEIKDSRFLEDVQPIIDTLEPYKR